MVGSYEGDCFYLFEVETKTLVNIVAPGDVLFPVDAKRGFFARKIAVAGQPRLELVPMSQAEAEVYWEDKHLPADFRRRHGEVLQPRDGLWALDAFAARHGMWHRMPRTQEPILTALGSDPQMETSVLYLTPAELAAKQFSFGGIRCPQGYTFSFWTEQATDGAFEVVAEPPAGRGEGCIDGGGRRRLKGATWAAEWTEMTPGFDGPSDRHVRHIYLTAQADTEAVAAAVHSILQGQSKAS